jgi:threonine dehydratase
MKASIEAGRAITLNRTHSIADGLMAIRPGDLTFAHVRRFVDAFVIVEDTEIAAAAIWLLDKASLLVEPSGAAAVAAALQGAAAGVDGPVVAIVSGGNVTRERLNELRP